MRRRITSSYILLSVIAVSVVMVLGCGSDSNTEASPVLSPTSRPAASPTASAASPTAPAPSATAPAASPTAPAVRPTPPAQDPAPPAGGAITVTMADFSYAPAAISARVGQQVQLSVANAGELPHTFTIANVTDSGIIAAGQTRTVTFTPAAAGTLTFFCAVHGAAAMSGQITVAP